MHTARASQARSAAAPVPSAAGLRPPEFTVDLTGQAVLRFPLELPPGIAGFAPKLELVYGHRQGNGMMGVGWSCNGLSAITRVKATYAVDGFNGAITYGSDDRFALDGQRLINVEGEYGGPGAVYYTEIQGWSYIQEVDGGFVVTTKNGHRMEYGATIDSRILAAGGSAVRVWALSALEDRNGNRIEYTYTQAPSAAGDVGSYYPRQIRYTVRTGLAANRTVDFTYEPRPDLMVYHVGGFPVTIASRLTRIATSVGADATPARAWGFQYETGAATALSRITAVTAYGADAEGLVSATVLWQDTPVPALSPVSQSALVRPGITDLIPLDIAGRGRTDLVQLWLDGQVLHANSYLAQGTGDSLEFVFACDSELGSFPATRQILPMDVDGDGRMDLVIAYQDRITRMLALTVYLSDGERFVPAPNSPYSTGVAWDEASHLRFFAADVNGDGRTDLVEAFSQDGQLHFRTWLSQFGERPGFGNTILSATEDPARPTVEAAFWAMDVNGDGMMDLVRVWRDTAEDVHATAYISVSTAPDHASFAKSVDSNLGAFTLKGHEFMPVDVNGDGVQDLLHVWHEPDGTTLHIATFLSTADGGFTQGPDSAFANQRIDPENLYPMGLNGAGQVSLVSPWSDTEGLLHFAIFQGSPAGVFRVLPEGAPVQDRADAVFFAGDPDGNGKADLIQVYVGTSNLPQLAPFLSVGPANDLASRITTALGGSIEVEYAPLSDGDVYGTTAPQPFPRVSGRRYPTPLTPAQFPAQAVLGQACYVVSSYSRTNNAEQNRLPYRFSSELRYEDAQVNLLGRGWQGFGKVRETRLDCGRATVQFPNQDFPLTGTIAMTRIEADGRYGTDPRAPKDRSVLMREVRNSYVVASGGAPGVVQVLRSATQGAAFDYGEDHFDFQLAETFDYDEYGNVTRQVNLGYVDPANNQPLFPDEVVYRHTNYQSDVFPYGGWALGFPRYRKVSANAEDTNITVFLPGDLELERNEYTAGTYLPASLDRWDDSNHTWLSSGYAYDEFGNRIAETAPGGFVTESEYDPEYHTYCMSVTTPPNAQGVRLTTAYGHDPRFGAAVARRDPNGAIFVTALDGFGRKSLQQGPAPDPNVVLDPNGLTPLVTGTAELKAAFLAAAVVTTETAAYLDDTRGTIYTMACSLQRFPTSATRDFLCQESITDGLGRERATVQASGQTAGDVVILKDYDGDGRTILESLPFFVPAGGAPSATCAIEVIYDVMGRPIVRQQPAGSDGSSRSTTTWSYSPGGYVTETAGTGTDVSFTQVLEHHFFDGHDRVRKTILPGDGGAVTAFDFDRIGRMLCATDPPTPSNPNGVSHRTTYDSLGRILTADNPDQNTTGSPNIVAAKYEYDRTTGRLYRFTDAGQASITYAYDAIGRVTLRTLGDASAITYVYDLGDANAPGHLSSVTAQDAAAVTQSEYALAYDAYGNQSSVTLTLPDAGSPFITEYQYDAQRRAVREVLPDRSVLNRQYSHGRLTGLQLGDAQVAFPLEDYHPSGKPGRIVYGGGDADGCLAARYTRNPAGLPYREIMANTAGTVFDYAYDYDLLNQVLRIGPPVTADGEQSFTYAGRRLVAATAPGFEPSAYAYDVSGNQTAKDGVTYSFRAHFPDCGSRDGVEVYAAEPDACGRTKRRTANGVVRTFEYDGLGALRRVADGSGAPIAEMLNNHQGQPVRQSDAGGTVRYFVSPSFEVTRHSDGSVSTARYLTDEQGALAVLDGGGVRYLRRDYKTTLTHLFDAAGTLTGALSYSPYGSFVPVAGMEQPGLKYEGRRWDEGSGFYYFGARYYDPVTGTFLTPDTQVGAESPWQPWALNRYSFELNNPAGYIDPSGHSADWVGGLFLGLAILAGGIAIVATAGTAAPLVGFLGAAGATAFASVLGGALIAGGVAATSYSLAHTSDFSWRDYGIGLGISAAAGAVTGGVFWGMGVASASLSAGWALGVSVVGGAVVTSASDVLAQLASNAALGQDLSSGLAASALFGAIFGAAGGAIGYGAGKVAERWASRVVAPEAATFERQASNLRRAAWAFRSGPEPGIELDAFPRTAEVAQMIRQQRIEALINRPVPKALINLVSSISSFPESYLESQSWSWS